MKSKMMYLDENSMRNYKPKLISIGVRGIVNFAMTKVFSIDGLILLLFQVLSKLGSSISGRR